MKLKICNVYERDNVFMTDEGDCVTNTYIACSREKRTANLFNKIFVFAKQWFLMDIFH